MYGLNKKTFKPVMGGMAVQKPMFSKSASGMSAEAAKNSIQQDALRKKQAIRKLRGA